MVHLRRRKRDGESFVLRSDGVVFMRDDPFEREIPVGKVVHAILDNYATRKHQKVCACLSAIHVGRSTSRQAQAQCG